MTACTGGHVVNGAVESSVRISTGFRERMIMREVRMENKEKILELVLPALQETRHLDDLVTLDYSKLGEGEQITATFINGAHKWVNVTADSGIQMLIDLLHGLL